MFLIFLNICCGMTVIAPFAMVSNNTDLENGFGKRQISSGPVLGLIFLGYADHRFTEYQKQIGSASSSGRHKIGPADYQALGVLCMPDAARFSAIQSTSVCPLLALWWFRGTARAG